VPIPGRGAARGLEIGWTDGLAGLGADGCAVTVAGFKTGGLLRGAADLRAAGLRAALLRGAAFLRVAALRALDLALDLRAADLRVVVLRAAVPLRAAAALRRAGLRAATVLRPAPLPAVRRLLAALRADAALCAAGLRAAAFLVAVFRLAVLRLPDREPDFVLRAISVHSPVEQEAYSNPSMHRV